MNILFVMYPWEKIQPETDSSIRLIAESCRRGHRVGVLSPNNLTIRGSVTYGFCKMLVPLEKEPTSIVKFYQKNKIQRATFTFKWF